MADTPAYRVVVQARASSSRLPRKAFLPLSGVPSVLLCLERAANAGADVVLATSIEEDDDKLARVVSEAGFRVVRGSLEDVLSRYVLAVEDLPDEAIVVRLTGDNVFPDGELVQDVVRSLVDSDAVLAHIPWPASGVPYGVAVEACYVAALRQSDLQATSHEHREHVTLEMKQRGVPMIGHHPGADFHDVAHIRCTLDTAADYDRLGDALDDVDDIRHIPWDTLVERLASSRHAMPVPYRTHNGKTHSALTLGTAQFGMAYGRTRDAGMPSQAHVQTLLARAMEHGFLAIDTARSYGESEARIGSCAGLWQNGQVGLVTKLDALAEQESEEACTLAVDASVLRSCRELRTHSLDTVLLHRWSHRTACGGALWRRLLELRDEGVVRRIGASVQNPDEAREALQDEDVEHIQLPVNVLDRRWRESGVPDLRTDRPDVVVHARSIFLQGILLAPMQSWPSLEGVDPSKWIRDLESVVDELGLASRAELCVRYALALDWVDSLVVGFDSVEQIEEVVNMSALGPLDTDATGCAEKLLAGAPARLLDPSKW